MNLSRLNIEQISWAIECDWQLALKANDLDDWLYRWGQTSNKLTGMADLLSFCSDMDPEIGAIYDDILLLQRIAQKLRFFHSPN